MSSIVISIPEHLKALVKPIEELIDSVDGRRRTARAGGRAMDYARTEAEVARRVQGIERSSHEILLSALDVDEKRVLIDGVLHRQVFRGPGPYRSMAGPVRVVRSLYRPVGKRNAPTVDAVGLRAGVVGAGWLPATASAMAHAVQMTTSRDAAEHARQSHRLPYSRSSFEEVAHEVGRHYVERHQVIEDELVARFVVAPEVVSISAAVDRVSVPMEEPRARPSELAPDEAPKNPIERVFRMAYVATLTLHNAQGAALHTTRYGRMHQTDPRELIRGLAMDIAAMREARPDLQVVTLADGAAEMWNLLEGELSEEELGVEILRLIDFWHLIEKLAAAAKVLDASASRQLIKRWKLLLLNRRCAVDTILAELIGSGCRNRQVGTNQPVHEAITYLENNGHRMRYTTARSRGLPIGSGQVEATCKSLVEVRMKRAGARWKNATGEHIIQLRALALSDRWDDALALTLAPLRQAVWKAAA